VAITWTATLETGIEVIDAQHRRIVDYINELETAQNSHDRGAVGHVLDELVDYTVSHFGFEESLQEEAGYKYAKPHKRVHDLFIKRVDEYVQRYRGGEDVAAEVHAMLSNWLINHIQHDDADYVSAVKANVHHLTTNHKEGGWLARTLKRWFR